MTVELRSELRVRGVAFSGGTKPELQVLLLQELGYGGYPHPGSQDGHPELGPTAEEPQLEEVPQFATVGTVPADPSVRPHPDYTLPPPGGLRALPRESTDSNDPVRTLELQLQLRRLEIEERRFLAQERTREAKERRGNASGRLRSGLRIESLSSGGWSCNVPRLPL